MTSESVAPGQVPFDLDAEQSVLGAVLRDPRCITDVAALVRTEDFYSPRNRGIFEMMLRVDDRQPGGCDPVSIAQEQERAGKAADLGGKAYLLEMMHAHPSGAYLEYHLTILRDLSLKRQLLETSDEIRRLVHSGEAESVEELIEKAENDVYRVGDRLVGKELVEIRQLIDDRLDDILDPDGAPGGLKTNYLDLDEKHGFRPGDLIVLAARPGMGKTALALNILERVAIQEQKAVLMFSLEMPDYQLLLRLLSCHAGIRHDNLRRGLKSSHDREALTMSATAFQKSRIYIDDSSQPSLAQIRAKARRLARDGDLDLIVVDYLQLLSTKAESRQQEISIISRTFKSIARDLKVPVLALSQLNRAAEKRDPPRPLLSDLRESGAIEQDADMVMMLYRPEYYSDAEEDRGLAEVSIAKNRHGSTGRFNLRWDGDFMRFENYTSADVLDPNVDFSVPSTPVFDD